VALADEAVQAEPFGALAWADEEQCRFSERLREAGMFDAMITKGHVAPVTTEITMEIRASKA